MTMTELQFSVSDKGELCLKIKGVSIGVKRDASLRLARLILKDDPELLALRRERDALNSKLEAIGELLSSSGCYCECDCDIEGHDDNCDRCLGCRIDEVLSR